MSIHPDHPGPPHPKLTSSLTRNLTASVVDEALAQRAAGVSWEEIGRRYRLPGVFGPHAAHEAACAIWTAAGEPGAPRWEDQPICACGAWGSSDAARDYFSACKAAFERWVAEH